MISNSKGNSSVDGIIASRERLNREYPPPLDAGGQEEEGGCGVTGFACSIPVGGKHIFEPSRQMHNRGNGKGGGIAAVGFEPEALGVTREVLDTHYMLQVALIDPEDNTVAKAVEDQFITPFLTVVKSGMVPTVEDWRSIPSLEVRPPDIMRYFVRVKQDVLSDFIEKNGFQNLKPGRAEDEFVVQNAIKLNTTFYSTLGEKKAFVMSHGRNMMILKIVGFAEDVASYYKLEEFKAHIWIAHQRYPTKGRVWHPGGAHPFSGMDEALVHNGDFANYYFRQRVSQGPPRVSPVPHGHGSLGPASRLLEPGLRLPHRVHHRGHGPHHRSGLRPASRGKAKALPAPSRPPISTDHRTAPGSSSSPGTNPTNSYLQLIGITDTAMLRPQVFALQEGEVQIGLVCSEKQAIDATLESLAKEDSRFCPIADRYWNARGGSHTDGGTFMFTIREEDGRMRLRCQDKFGKEVSFANGQQACDASAKVTTPEEHAAISRELTPHMNSGNAWNLFSYLTSVIQTYDYNAVRWTCDELVAAAATGDIPKATIIEALTLVNDRRFDTSDKKRASILWIVRGALTRIFDATPRFGRDRREPLSLH